MKKEQKCIRFAHFCFFFFKLLVCKSGEYSTFTQKSINVLLALLHSVGASIVLLSSVCRRLSSVIAVCRRP